MSEKVLEMVPLSNGATLTITNASREISKEAVRVEIIFSVQVPTDLSLLSDNCASPEVVKKIGEIGKEVALTYHRAKAFVMKEDLNATIKTVIADFNANILPYISKPDFPKKLTQARCKELRSLPHQGAAKVSN